MSKSSSYPKSIKVGSAVVKIYKVHHKNAAAGCLYTVAWHDGTKRHLPQFADPDEAEKEARLIASKLSTGDAEAAKMTGLDRKELQTLRDLAVDGIPVVTAMQEWNQAWKITGGRILDAAKAFAAANGTSGLTPIPAVDAVEKFLHAKKADGVNAKRTYETKVNPIATYFGDRELHTITTAEWQAYLMQWPKGSTRNDLRKRAVTLCRWAQDMGYINRGAKPEIERTSRKNEDPTEVGIITPETYGKLLRYLRFYHPQYLAAAVLAGFCGERSHEIHGSRKDPERRQLWSDIHSEGAEPMLVVSYAKRNTPSWRTVPICPAALKWLRFCRPQDGVFICPPYAMDRVRAIGIAAGLDLPENCFRHSFISYQVILTGSKHQVATWAGNSVERIDKHYRRPVFAELGETLDLVVIKPITKSLAEKWVAMTPELAESLPHLVQRTPAENGRLGGIVKSPEKLRAWKANLRLPS